MTVLKRVLLVVLYAFLLAPLAIVVVTSFSNDGYLSFPA
jgi:ABC-type spermidine/putrescine transport system permease subunit II